MIFRQTCFKSRYYFLIYDINDEENSAPPALRLYLDSKEHCVLMDASPGVKKSN